MRLLPLAVLLLAGCGAPSARPDACARLAAALGLEGTEATLTAAALRAGDPGIWGAVREDHAEAPPEGALEPLLALARTDLDLEALRTLGLWRRPEAVPLLEAFLDDPRPAARAEGLWGLRALAARGRLGRVRELAADPDPAVRAAAAAALGLLGDAGDLSLLRTLREDEDPDVSIEALLALGYRGEKDVEEDLRELLALPHLREEVEMALEALERMTDLDP